MMEIASVVPCFSMGDGCQADWTAIGAVGGLLGAAAAAFASVVALHLAASERRKREAHQKAAHKFALMGLWPRLHRAQGALATIAGVIGSEGVDRPTAGDRDALAGVIEALQAELTAIGVAGVNLQGAEGERLAATVAIAGYVARQSRRIARPESPTMLDAIWYAPDLRFNWAADARTAVGQLLAFASDAEAAVNQVSGRHAPHYPSSNEDGSEDS